jgi:hypothetical protein
MGEVLGFIWCAIAGLFRSRVALQAEILVLRHQLNVVCRRSPKRVVLGNIDRPVFCGLYRLSPPVLGALSRRPLSVGIALVSKLIGAGDHDGAAAGQGSR